MLNTFSNTDLRGFDQKPVSSGLPSPLGPLTAFCSAYEQALVIGFRLTAPSLDTTANYAIDSCLRRKVIETPVICKNLLIYI